MESVTEARDVGEFQVAGFTFFSNFDSGNLAHIQLATTRDNFDDGDSECSESESPRPGPGISRPSTSSAQPRSVGVEQADYEFELWTRPDCAGTEFENGNRTWFYFGMKGGTPGSVLSFTVKNLNKQAKLFSQGMVPVFLIPGRSNNWERLRDGPTYSTKENNFMMTFKFRNLDTDVSPETAVYFAFTYPYSYRELQTNLTKYEKKFQNGDQDFAILSTLPDSGMYFHRELVTFSLESRRLDLLTITGLNNILPEREPNLQGLFPGQSCRPYRFRNKKIVFLSARVHPGETCSSHVINGLVRFLLKENDARAVLLRRKYVFKVIPMLNPDGVVNGHYRTDTRGVNLNRVYSAPSPDHHPTIYATKKLILLAHLGHDVDLNIVKSEKESAKDLYEQNIKVDAFSDKLDTADDNLANVNNLDKDLYEQNSKVNSFSDVLDTVDDNSLANVNNLDTIVPLAEPEWYKPQTMWDVRGYSRARTSASSRVSTSSRSSNMSSTTPFSPMKGSSELALHWYEMTDTSRCSEGDESIADFSVPSYGSGPSHGHHLHNRHPIVNDESSFLPPAASSTPSSRTNFAGAFKPATAVPTIDNPKEVINNNNGHETVSETNISEEVVNFDDEIPLFKPSGDSNLFLYVDVHGHASKRGIFMYGNHFDNLETKVSALVYPKLMAINSANFDFPACNFTQRNMVLKDRHTGAGREGSGRVSVYKATGLTYCYTLECNFNTGRHTNTVPIAAREGGRVSPPPVYDNPPKYNMSVYEDCGKYLAVSILDLTETNPWTRLPCSSCKNMKGLRSWLRQYLKNAEAESAASKAAKSSKSSPMRTRLRSLSAGGPKKTPRKARRPPSGSNPDGGISSGRPISKVARKVLSPKSSSTGPPSSGKMIRQNSNQRSKSAKQSSDGKKRCGSGKKNKALRPTSKTNSRGGSKSTSKPNSRSSSPRRMKLDGKSIDKNNLQKKKSMKKISLKNQEDQSASGELGFSIKKVKRKKKPLPPTT